MLEMVVRVRLQPGIGQVREVESAAGSRAFTAGVTEAVSVGGGATGSEGEHFLSGLGATGTEEGNPLLRFLSNAWIKFLQFFRELVGSQVTSEHPSHRARYSTLPPSNFLLSMISVTQNSSGFGVGVAFGFGGLGCDLSCGLGVGCFLDRRFDIRALGLMGGYT